ncbi:MAG TPA: trypsin-like peptidase domain-containing protein [Acetobacteraceae bacterium]|nr:trypsin-like peptidase domain-containing protein [Acetobacteraceae bacterium]
MKRRIPIMVFALLALIVARPIQAAPMPPALAPIAARALPAVVTIESIDPMKSGPQGAISHPEAGVGQAADSPTQRADTNSLIIPPRAEQALGAGFIISPDGYIVTNHHVIAGASEIHVSMRDGQVYPAKLIGADAQADLALLKINTGHPLPFLKFGDSTRLADGDWVMAIGNPFGLSFSVSAGVVSALHRDIGSGPFDNFIQTDAAINRGNSGGPLLNENGHVIGIDTAIYSPSGGSVGIGFAIPSSMIQPVVAQLRTHGKMVRGWAGVRIEHVSQAMADAWHLKSADGVVIAGTIPKGPAVGILQPGDVVLRVGPHRITDSQSFRVALAEIPAGSEVPVEYWRAGSVHQASLDVARIPEQPGRKPATVKPRPLAVGALGLSVLAHPKAESVAVVTVEAGGPAARAGIEPGALIEAVGPDFVDTPEALQAEIGKLTAARQSAATLLVAGKRGASWVPVQLSVQQHPPRHQPDPGQ